MATILGGAAVGSAAVVGAAALATVTFIGTAITKSIIGKSVEISMLSFKDKKGQKKLDKQLENFHHEVGKIVAKVLESKNQIDRDNLQSINEEVLKEALPLAPKKVSRSDIKDIVETVTKEIVKAVIEENTPASKAQMNHDYSDLTVIIKSILKSMTDETISKGQNEVKDDPMEENNTGLTEVSITNDNGMVKNVNLDLVVANVLKEMENEHVKKSKNESKSSEDLTREDKFALIKDKVKKELSKLDVLKAKLKN